MFDSQNFGILTKITYFQKLKSCTTSRNHQKDHFFQKNAKNSFFEKKRFLVSAKQCRIMFITLLKKSIYGWFWPLKIEKFQKNTNRTSRSLRRKHWFDVNCVNCVTGRIAWGIIFKKCKTQLFGAKSMQKRWIRTVWNRMGSLTKTRSALVTVR